MGYKKYLVILQTTIKDAFAYRAEGLVYFMADLMTPLIMMVTWQAIFKNQTNVGGYTIDGILIYYLMVFIFRTVLSVYPHEISVNIKSGDLNSYLLKPLNVISYHLILEFAWKLIRIVFLFITVVFLFYTLLSKTSIPALDFSSPWFYLSIITAFLLNFYLKVVLELLAFWLTEVDGIRISFYIFESFFAGALLPLNLMPGIVQTVAKFLPFSYFFSFPTQIILKTITPGEVLAGLFISFIWLAGAILLSQVIWKKGLRQYGAVSG